MHYEGLTNRDTHTAAIENLHFWIRLAHILHTDLIQIPSNFLPDSQCTGDRATIIADLREVADIGLTFNPPIRFAYEALCWGTHTDKWDDAWSIVTEVDRPNFGTCIDTFNLAGRVYADPASATGLTPNAVEDMRSSIQKLRTELSRAMDKVFYVEVCDGERLNEPLLPGHEWYQPDQPARMTWSRNARLFPFEEPGYMPVLDILEAVCEAGYTGHISFELFSRTANRPEESVPREHARRAAIAWEKLEKYMGWASEGVDCIRERPDSGYHGYTQAVVREELSSARL
jgi:4-hydroxyphenylpyruvate dioxygenase